MHRTLITLAAVLPVLLAAWILVQLTGASDEALMNSCAQYSDRYGVKVLLMSPDSICGYLKWVHDPDPNQPVRSGDTKTLFGHALTGHAFNGAQNKAGSQGLIEQFLQHGIDWDKSHNPGLPPLLLAVRIHSPDLITRLLESGADPRQIAKQPGAPFHGLDAFDYARLLRTEVGDSQDEGAIDTLLGIEARLCDDPSVKRHALVGPQNITVDGNIHEVLPMDALGEEGMYPADNYDVLQGVVDGPLGDHKSAGFALVGVWAYENVGLPCMTIDAKDSSVCAIDPRKASAPSRLEAILSVHGDSEKDGDLGWTTTVKLKSIHDTPNQEARLLGVDSMGVADVDNDGNHEIRANVRFAMGCGGEPYTEVFVLKITGDKVTRLVLNEGQGDLDRPKNLSSPK